MTVQLKLEKLFENTFEWWAKKLVYRRKLIMIISAIVLLGLSSGMSMRKEYDNSENLWSPQNNPSELNYKRS